MENSHICQIIVKFNSENSQNTTSLTSRNLTINYRKYRKVAMGAHFIKAWIFSVYLSDVWINTFKWITSPTDFQLRSSFVLRTIHGSFQESKTHVWQEKHWFREFDCFFFHTYRLLLSYISSLAKNEFKTTLSKID